MNRVEQRMQAALSLLGLWDFFANKALRAASYEAAREALEEIHAKAKEAHKQLALQAHPDRGGDTAKMAEINAAYDLVQQLNVQQPRPVFQYATVVRIYTNGFGSATTSTVSW